MRGASDFEYAAAIADAKAGLLLKAAKMMDERIPRDRKDVDDFRRIKEQLVAKAEVALDIAREIRVLETGKPGPLNEP